MRAMNSFHDFCEWAGSQRQAAALLKVSEATVSRWRAKGCVPSVSDAEKVEAVSNGRYHWTQMMRPPAVPVAAAQEADAA